MKLQYLGTAAAEGIPAIFCTCATCQRARALGGKNIRTRSQALLDDTLLIDFPADTYFHSMREGIDLTHVHNVINTHTHADHLYPEELYNYAKGFANLPEGHPSYHFWGGQAMVEKLIPFVNFERMENRLHTHLIELFTPTKIADYTVTALPATHGTEDPRFYIIEKDGKTLLYVQDSGEFKQEVWDYLKRERPYFNLASFDCTFGSIASKPGSSHMGLINILDTVNQLESIGCMDENTVRVVNHFSHNVPNVNYEDRSVYEEKGFLMSYDGMVVEL